MNENGNIPNNTNVPPQNNLPQSPPPYNVPTKLCKHCKSPMDFQAKVCPTCKRKQGANKGCLIAIIVVVAIFAFIIAFIGACSKAVDDAIKEDKKKKEESKVSAETVIYDKDDIKITYTGMQDDTLSMKIHLKIENNSDNICNVSSRELSIDGYSLSDVFSAEVAPKKTTNDDITILHSELEKNKLDYNELKEAELKFHFSDLKHFTDSTDTESIKFKLR